MEKKKLNKNTAVCIAIFALYALLSLIGALNHELWYDEAQAWTITRDNTIGGIFHQLSYEGHPPLWYLILYVFSHTGFECTVIPIISWVITAAAAAVVMFKAPFHIVTKAALLFSGGFLFFNSVMSRVYCLINLLAVLTAWLYPKRKAHPILFGILIALLANTHVCISGFIGIMGIFMITDLFKGFRTNTAKQNAAEIAGLAISGAGVLLMVIPLLHSVSLNGTTSKFNYTFRFAVGAALDSFSDISMSLLLYDNKNLFMFFVAGIMAVLLFAEFILMRHKTRPFLMLVFFTVFYIITSQILWYTIQNRAHIFVLMFFVTAWIAESEPQNGAGKIWTKFNFKTETKAIENIIGFVQKLDKGYMRYFNIILTAVLIVSVPAGARFLFGDYIGSFSPSKKAAEYIKNNFPANTVFVTEDEVVPSLAAYLLDYRFYSKDFGRFYTYNEHKNHPENLSYESIYNDLKDCENVYYIDVHVEIDFIPSNRKVVYIIRDGMPYGGNICYVEISEFDLDKEIKSVIDKG
ncbi:MAG: hypothetical protein K2N60_12540 [Oscillospiraceae bacterium]|nr:hypothetical protein [Oscillospiraceae bacterium]